MTATDDAILLKEHDTAPLPATIDTVGEIAKSMANAARMRLVGRMCLLAALMRLSDEIDELCDVHAAAIANGPGSLPAEMLRLKSAARTGIAAIKAEPQP